MRRRLDPLVRRWWRGEAGRAGALLTAMSVPARVLWAGVVGLRRTAYDRGWLQVHRVGAPVVSVGNLTVGGTGKTPFTGWLAGALAHGGTPTAVVSRGYGEDELRLHRRWNPDVPVHADADRVAAAHHAVSEGARAVVLDDGFQHRRLGRDVDLVLLSAEQPFPGRLLPAGPYREGPGSLARADVVVVTRRVADDEVVERLVAAVGRHAPDTPVVVVELAPSGWTDLVGAPVEPPAAEVVAVTAVAEPGAFAALVARETGREPELLAFPDHHVFDAGDVDRIVRAAGPRTLAVTEKDAVKLASFARTLPPTRVLALRVVPGPGTRDVLDRVRAALRHDRNGET